MGKITVKELAGQAINLAVGESIGFLVKDEDFHTHAYVISHVRLCGSHCLLANNVNGGRPLAIDVTIYDEDLLNVCDTLDKYINNASGDYGYVDVTGRVQDAQEAGSSAQDKTGTHMLISVTERDITTAFFPSYQQAYDRMEKELEETMSGDREGYTIDDEYSIGEFSAWSNADHNANSDWLIVEITEENTMAGYTGDSGSSSERLSVHIGWDRLGELGCKYLSELLGREIYAESKREEYYYWGFNIDKTPLSKEEIEMLFLVTGADEHDRDSNDFGDYPIMEINQGLAEKMLAPALLFIMSSSHADDNGVWFFGPIESQMVSILMSYPETDMEPDIFRFALNGETTKEGLISCIQDAISELPEDDDADRLSRLDEVITRVTEKTGCKSKCFAIDYEAEIY